jgi:hypothetical protein
MTSRERMCALKKVLKSILFHVSFAYSTREIVCCWGFRNASEIFRNAVREALHRS